MPKATAHPRLRSHSWRTKGGEVKTAYYYDMRGTGEKDVPLGSDFAAAVRQWDELHNRKPREVGTLKEAFDRWELEVLPGYESPETKRDYAKSLRQLRPALQGASWDEVTLPALKGYLNKRTGKTRANREMSLLSLIWNWARTEGLTTLPFPAHSMAKSRWKNREQARQVEFPQEVFDAIYRHGDQVLRDYMDLSGAMALRMRDALALRITDVRQRLVHLRSQKRGKLSRFEVEASEFLPKLIERRMKSKAAHIFMLAVGDSHKLVTERMLHDRFKKAQALAVLEVPECAGLHPREVRKYAAQQVGSLQEAAELLQHDDTALTRRHYRPGELVKPAR